MNAIFKKNRCPTSGVRHEKKNRMHRHTIFRNYCRYYDRYYCRHAIVVTTVVMENCMPTHEIFILMSDARCQAPFLRKNRASWMTTTTRRSVQHSLAQKSGQPSNDECTIHRHPCDSQNLSGVRSVFLHRRNPSKPRVSRAVGVCSDDSSRAM